MSNSGLVTGLGPQGKELGCSELFVGGLLMEGLRGVVSGRLWGYEVGLSISKKTGCTR